MTERRALFIQGDGAGPEHSAEDVRLLAAAVLGGENYSAVAPGIGAIARGHGVIGANSLRVTANATPNNTVHVAPGVAAIRGTQANDQGVYLVGNDASVQLTINPSTTNPRRDLVVAQIRDGQYPSHSGDDWELVVVEGTPAGSPVDPPVPEDALVLARVRVPTGVSAVISAAEIDDLRPRVVATGGITPVASLAAWPSPQPGDVVWRTDAERLAVRTSTAWRHLTTDYVDHGSVTITGGVATRIANITFGVTFAANPRVVCTPRAATGQSLTVTITAVSTTGATISVSGTFGNIAGSPAIDYIAVGPLA